MAGAYWELCHAQGQRQRKEGESEDHSVANADGRQVLAGSVCASALPEDAVPRGWPAGGGCEPGVPLSEVTDGA